MIQPPRSMSAEEIDALLALDVPAHLATLDAEGFPHVTPLWFIWAGGAFHLTSFPDRPHLARLRGDARAGICVDIERPERDDGQRPNQQVRATGTAELAQDEGGYWTQLITEKYLSAPAALERARGRARSARVVIHLRPHRLLAVASV